jgi:hypothetical protein
MAVIAAITDDMVYWYQKNVYLNKKLVSKIKKYVNSYSNLITAYLLENY